METSGSCRNPPQAPRRAPESFKRMKVVAAIRVFSVAGASTSSFGLVGTTAFRFSAMTHLLGFARIQLLIEGSAVERDSRVEEEVDELAARVDSMELVMARFQRMSPQYGHFARVCPLAGSQQVAAPPQGRGGSSKGRPFPGQHQQQQRIGEKQFRPFQQPGPSRFG
ncbi:hypothetical protein F511_15776 [Dorcoceras hygrometricum]|nr:hypothetical protein F511_15776 [Dorcoceras hygrometricum]